MLRNRRTNETFEVTPGGLSRVKKNSMFAKQTTDFSAIEQFIQEFRCQLPASLSSDDKDKITKKLRQELSQKNKDIDSLMNDEKSVEKLFLELKSQIKNLDGKKEDTHSTFEFLKSLISSIGAAKLNSAFPGLMLLSTFIPAAAAQFNYSYFPGQPQGGEDLCANTFNTTLYNCIQGYLTELGQAWNPDMPQIARTFEPSVDGAKSNCINQADLENMLTRAYRGPNELGANCLVKEAIDNSGNISVFATKVDPITCDIMQDSAVGFAAECNAPPPSSNNLLAGLIGGIVLTPIALITLAFALSKLKERNRPQELLDEEKGNYNSVQNNY